MRLSVIIPTHNPHPERLRRTLAALAAQTLPSSDWELIIIDNASSPALWVESLLSSSLDIDSLRPVARLIAEPTLGLTAARRCGFTHARGEILLLVDDDNLLAPDYLTQTLAAFARLPASVEIIGGKSLPEFTETSLASDDWRNEFLPLLALRNLGPTELISQPAPSPSLLTPESFPPLSFPSFAPIGAGMALRAAAAQRWLAHSAHSPLTDRCGTALTSGGDNDIVLTALRAGAQVAYLPALSLTHLIPSSRLTPTYLARINRGIQHSWMQVLTLHHANPWPPLSPFAARLRQIKAWFTYRAWSYPKHYIRWAGAAGHFSGRTNRQKFSSTV